MALENIFAAKGTLKQCFEKIVSETILHSDEIQEKRLVDEEFRKLGSWTADFPLYVLDGKEAVLYLARRDNNLVFQNINNAVEQILKTRNYKVNSDDAQQVITAESTLKIPLSELKLECLDDEWGYFKINTSKYDELNSLQRAFAERVHGSGEQFGKVMGLLAETIKETKIYTLNPDYVKNNAEDNAIARVCWLNYFDNYSNFYAGNWFVDGYDGALCGVRREKVVAEGDVREKMDESLLQIKPALEKGSAFEYKGRIYVPVDKSADLKI